MTLLKRNSVEDLIRSINDDLAGITTFGGHSGLWQWDSGRTWVDTTKYDIVPKESHRQELIKKKEEEIKDVERNREASMTYYDNRLKQLKEEKDKLLNSKSLP